jgi:lipopolysaccharide transport system permease protein
MATLEKTPATITNPKTSDETPLYVIKPSKGWVGLRLGELWQYRELVFHLGMRDVRVRYKQTIIGAAWAVIQPFMTMVVFTVFFGTLARMPSDGLPYPIFSYTALVPWAFFSGGLGAASGSLMGAANMMKKIYFPRFILPISSMVGIFVDFAIAFSVLLLMMVSFGFFPTINIIWLPVFLVVAFITALGVGLWLASLTVQFRDVRYIVPFIMQFWMYATPIVYPSSLIEDELLRTLYGLNPMTGVIEGFRWALLGSGDPPGAMFVVSIVAAILILIGGAYYFRRTEKVFADVL